MILDFFRYRKGGDCLLSRLMSILRGGMFATIRNARVLYISLLSVFVKILTLSGANKYVYPSLNRFFTLILHETIDYNTYINI